MQDNKLLNMVCLECPNNDLQHLYIIYIPYINLKKKFSLNLQQLE